METQAAADYNAIKLLQTELTLRKQRNPRYSLRSFALNLGISPAQLSQLISGKRNFTSSVLGQISKGLHLSPEEESSLFSQTLLPKHIVSGPEKEKRQFAEDEFRAISEWYHFAILSLSKIRGATTDPFWIADRLGITPTEARTALERLLRLKLIEEGKILKRTTLPLNVTSEVPSSAIQNYHHKILTLAQEKLRDAPPEKRDFSAVTFATSPDKLPQARKMIEEFQDKLVDFLATPHAKEVFVMACQFFSLERK